MRHYPSQMHWLVPFLFLAGCRALHASEKDRAAARVEEEINAGRQLMADIMRFARQGDDDFKGLLENLAVRSEADWNALRRKPEKVEEILRGLCKSLLTLARHNARATSLVQKYKIKEQ
jgi:hypothetical protein